MLANDAPTRIPVERRRRAIGLIAALGLALSLLTAASAVGTRGAPFPALFVDAYGAFSDVYLGSWGAGGLGLHFPDRLVAVDGERLVEGAPRYGALPVARLTARLAALAAAGRSEARLDFDRGGHPVSVVRPIRRIGVDEIVFLYGLYALVGLFVLWSGLTVLVLAGRREGAGAYAFLATGSCSFLLTLFDYHTRARFAPLFTVSMIWTAVGCAWLAYAFPAPPRRLRGPLRAALGLASATGGASALLLVLAPAFGVDGTPLRVFVNLFFQACLFVVALSLGLRLRTARDRDRDELRSAVLGLALVPVLIAAGLFVGGPFFYLLLPSMIAGLPLSIGYALVRHNILATTSILTHRLLVVPLAIVSAVLVLFAWAGVRLVVGDEAAGPRLVAGAVALGPLFYVLLGRFVLPAVFPAAAYFRPSIAMLADQLASLRGRGEIRRAVEQVVTRWLPTERVAVAEIDAAAPGALPDLRRGENVWTSDDPRSRHLLVPMRSNGELRAVLDVAPKHDAAPYTSEDLVLLETIANLGAVALHNTEVLEQLDAFRKLQVEATRDEKRLALGLLGAEISHEIAYPLNFFRYLLKRGAGGRALDEQDVEVGREEVERLERMLLTLRRLRPPEPRHEPVPIAGPLRRALDLLREPIREQKIHLSVEVAPDLAVLADPDPLLQLFANLLRNALQAAGEGGAIGVRATRDAGGIAVLVWDSGPGVPEALRETIFNPWVTTREGGSGLGLAITQRIARGFGWSIALEREDGRTCFIVRIPVAGLPTALPTEAP